MGTPVFGIDASRLSARHRTGTETYSHALLTAMAALDPAETFRLYLNAAVPPDDLPQLGDPVCMPFPRLWTHLRLSAEMARRVPDVLFVPAHVVPLVHPKSVVTIHDLGYVEHPESHTPRSLRMLDLTTRWSARASRRIIAISDVTRQALIDHCKVPASKIDVIPHGVDPTLRPASTDSIAAVRQRLGLPDRYVVTVGTVQSRKNLVRLVSAMERVAAAGLPHGLVIAGARGWMADEIDKAIAASPIRSRIVVTGYVDRRDIAPLLTGADAYAFPSLYEGFGMPALEAMACGVPVVASNRAALPAVVGDAGLLIDPYDAVGMGDALVRVLVDSALRDDLVARGTERITHFSWTETAARTLAVLRQVAAS